MEERAVEVDQSFLDNRHILALPMLDVHHGDKRISSGQPLAGTLLEVPHAAHEPSVSRLYDGASVESKRVAVITVKGSREGTSSLISKIICQWFELALVILSFFELLLHEVDDQLLCFDLGDLDVAVRVAVQQQLIGYFCREEVEESLRGLAQVLVDDAFELFRVDDEPSDYFVDFRDELIHLGDELDQSFRDQHHSVIFALLCPLDDNLDQLSNEFLQGLLLGLYFLPDERVGRPGQQRAFQGNMRGRSAHKPDEVIVLLRGEGIRHDGSNTLRVRLAGSIEPKTHLNKLILQIPINSLGASYYSNIGCFGEEVLGQQGSVGVGIIASDDHQPIQFQRLANWSGFQILSLPEQIMSKPPRFLKQSTWVQLIQMYSPVKMPRGPLRKPKSCEFLQADYHVVAACCLSARQHAAHSQCAHDGLSLLSCSEVDCLYASFCSFREDGGDARRDLGWHLQALEEGLLQDLGSFGLVLGAVGVKG